MEKNMNSAVCLLDRAAEKYGDKTAFEDADTSISFNELKEKARAVGSGLLKRVKTGGAHPIVVYLPKSVNSVIGFIGAMYAGSPYAPVNYDAPLVRLEKIVSTLVPSAIITDDEGKKRLEALETEADILLPEDLMSEPADDAVVDEAIEKVCASDPAYIMFTSGTTGIPKGVTVSGESLINLVRWCTDTFEFDENDIWGLAAPFHFDSTITDIYSSIYKGSAVCIIPEALLMYPDRLMEYVAEKKISCIHWVPTIIKRVANSGVLEKLKLPDLKLVLSGAEIMPNKQLNIWRKNLPQCIYANLYGPTEATVESAYYIVDREFHDDDRLPIGKACKNTRILILNEDDKPCKTGEKGELCIGGTGVALGYWNEPELTKSVFVQNPLNGLYRDIIYRTGDIAYENDDGNIIFVGRRDSQIKLRGNRIELGEIESSASAMDGVNGVCALFDSEKQEIALFLETPEKINARRFRMSLQRHIPKYMIPDRIVAVESFPYLPNGKINRMELRDKYINRKEEEK